MADRLDNTVRRNIDAKTLQVDTQLLNEKLHMTKMAGIVAGKLVDRLRANRFVVRVKAGRRLAIVEVSHNVGNLGHFEPQYDGFGIRSKKYGEFLSVVKTRVGEMLQLSGFDRFHKRHAEWTACRTFEEPGKCCLPIALYRPFGWMEVRVEFDVSETKLKPEA